MENTEAKKQAAIGVVIAIAEAIKASGAKGIPGGHLYAACMQLMDLDTFQSLMRCFEASGQVRKEHDRYYVVN